MNKNDNLIDNTNLESEELYLFNTSNPLCPPESSLWGVFDRYEGKQILLESESCDLRNFNLWKALPDEYNYCRLATRKELRQYMNNITIYECCKLQHCR